MNRAPVRFAFLSVAAFLLAACGGTSSPAQAEAEVDDGSTMFTAVRDHCELPGDSVGDSGTTLILDGAETDDPEGLSIEVTGCALGAIDTPDSIVSQIEKTRALDGRQTATNDGYTYSWVYHPDTGLDITITDAWQD